MKYLTVLILTLLPVLTLAEAKHHNRHLELPAKSINLLVLNCGAGFLDLKGVDGLDKIVVAAEIEIEDIKKNNLQNFFEKNIVLKLEKQENKAILRSQIVTPHLAESPARINLTVEVPKKMNVRIIDGSGAISVNDLFGNLEIDDASGSIKIENITGKIKVDDGSGSIDIEEVTGKVEVKDGSGSIDIYLVEGDVSVTDGSGPMTIRDIAGNVTVSDDSGSIEIKNVSHNVFIRETGSGELSTEGIGGTVTIRE